LVQLRKQSTRCNFTGYFIIPSQLYMFRRCFRPPSKALYSIYSIW